MGKRGREQLIGGQGLVRVEAALEEIRRGRMVVVCDGEGRGNEGDLVLAAQFAIPEAINFMATHARGLVPGADAGALRGARTRPDGSQQRCPLQTAFTVSVEARDGVSTGISVHDRARTVQVAIDPHSRPDDLVQPGHMFPLKAAKGGVLERTGHAEAAVDLARLAGLIRAGVICEIMNEDETMARMWVAVPDVADAVALADPTGESLAEPTWFHRRPRREDDPSSGEENSAAPSGSMFGCDWSTTTSSVRSSTRRAISFLRVVNYVARRCRRWMEKGAGMSHEMGNRGRVQATVGRVSPRVEAAVEEIRRSACQVMHVAIRARAA